MKNLVLVITLIVANLGTVFAQKGHNKVVASRGMAVAFADRERLSKATLDDFQFFLKMIQEIVKRDFPGVELRVVGHGDLVRFPDGTALNVQNVEPPIGFVLSVRGKKRRVLQGIQTDADFACAAASFFRRPSPACPK